MERRAIFLGAALAGVILACNAPAALPAITATTGGVPANKPSIVIQSPAPGVTVIVGQALQVQSLASDSVGVTRVEMQVNGVVVRNDTAPDPDGQKTLALLQNWTPSQPGSATITLIAYRADGTTSDPASLVVNVIAPTLQGPSATPTTGPCTAQASTDLNVRGGPGTAYPILGVLGVGKTTPITGRNNDTSWWQIGYSGGPGGRGWVSAIYITTSGDCTSVLPASFAPPPPTRTPTPTLTPVPSITPTLAPPDLIVTVIEMPTTLYLVSGKALTTIKVTIKNIGGQKAAGFKTIVYPTGRGGAGGVVDLGLVALLNPGEILSLSVDYVYTVAGTYTVEAVVDPDNKVVEGDEGNNIRTLTIQVSPLTITATP